MKKIFFIITVCFIFINCSKKTEKNIENLKIVSRDKVVFINNIFYYKNTKKVYTGQIHFYNDEDEKILTAEFGTINGIINGAVKSYNQDGYLQQVFYYKDNKLLPKFKEFREDSTLLTEIKQLNNDKVEVICYNENSKPVFTYEAIFNYEKNFSPYELYDFKRKRIKSCFFIRDGAFKIYDENGNLIDQLVYKNDILIKKDSIN